MSDFVVSAAALAELGFADAARAAKLALSLAETEAEKAAFAPLGEDLLQKLARSADPMRALLNFSNLRDALPDKVAFFEKLAAQKGGLRRLARLLGWSQALADFVIGAPELLTTVLGGGEAISRPALRRLARIAASSGENPKEKLDALRRFRHAQTLRIGLLDLDGASWRDAGDFGLVTRQISDLAQVVVEAVLKIVADGKTDGFCVLMLGKGGARELNYSSDIDLVFLSDGRGDAAEIGTRLLRELGEITAAGRLFRVDMRLRPDGGAGPLVTAFSYALSYYESYAAAWEWQALIKTRSVAGDADLGRRFRKFTRAVTWARRADDAHLREVFELKKRSEATPEGLDLQNVKQGPGGIRDAEWVVQQLQMMVGPTHPRARASATLRALDRLDELDALSPDEARQLREGYLWLRACEHRLQLLNEQAIRVLPKDQGEQAALARRLGSTLSGGAAARWLAEEHARHRREIRGLCERIFWQFSDEEGDWEAALPPAAAGNLLIKARLERLAHGTQTRPLPAPLSRQIRAVLPGALGGLARAANPERALANFENLCEASGNRLSLLRSLDGSPGLSDAIFTILGGAQSLAETLIRFPQLLDLTANRGLLDEARDWEAARAECRAYCLAFRDRKAALRRWRGREMLRIGLRDLITEVSPHEITREIALLAGACLDLAVGEVANALRPASDHVAFAVLALGKFGGLEMHYASDCDVLFTYATPQPSPVQSALALRWAEELIAFLGERTEDGPGFSLDARLRPHGSSGALASPVEAYRDYFERDGSGFAVWERQALTRARFAAGDGAAGARLITLARHAAFPEPWKSGWSDELRRVKKRVETERTAKGAAAGAVFEVKLGPGGLADIEWCGQWLALKHGAKFPALQTPNTRGQLEAAKAAGLVSASEFEALEAAYTWLRRAELRLQIAREGGATAVKRGSEDLKLWARAIFPGLDGGEAVARFEDEWRHHTGAARGVFERVRDGL